MRLHAFSKGLIALSFGLAASASHAATVAVVDSGLDTESKDLATKIWLNPVDSTVDGIDQGNNGYVDDIHGWSFIDNSYKLIDHKYANLYSNDIVRFFAVQSAGLKGKATAEDKAWANSLRKDQSFLKRLTTYGNYAHGTHVSGIVANQGDGVKVLGVKLIATENPLGSIRDSVSHALADGQDINFILRVILKGGLGLLAQAQAQAFTQIGQYVGGEKVDVVNGSFGIGPVQARVLLTPLLTLASGHQPAAKLVDEFVGFFLGQLIDKQAAFVDAAPSTLFVFASGNDGSNNDLLPTAPASIKSDRVISVAATFGDGRLAPFSNFGATTVDLAAPGVAIESTVPDDHRLLLSGTSQAAPHVAGTAGAVNTLNPALTPVQIKKIILGTVDIKPELKDKVKSSGILNNLRAQEAARLSLNDSLDSAIAHARNQVPDVATEEALVGTPDMSLWLDLQPHVLSN